jgi:hypothetical protein
MDIPFQVKKNQMKLGSLIRPKFQNGIILFHHLEKRKWSSETQSWWYDGTGLVVDIKNSHEIPNDLTATTWVRILTPGGVGWSMLDKIELVEGH